MNQPRGPFAADDWGMTPEINEAILELARAGALASVSVMANLPYLRFGLEELSEIPGVELALHLNFTLGPSLARPGKQFGGLKALAKGLALGSVDRTWIQEEIAAQYSSAAAAGARLKLFDGHQHVHLLPPIFPMLASFARAQDKPRIRSVVAATHPAFFLAQICRRLPAAREIVWVPHSVRREPGVNFRAIVHPAVAQTTQGIRQQDGSPALRENDYQFVRTWLNNNLSKAGDTQRPDR